MAPACREQPSASFQQWQLRAATAAEEQVVLFGVGDLRVDDHVGLQRALEYSRTGGSVRALFWADDATLARIPGAVAHTYDTARLLQAALADLSGRLATLGLSLEVHFTENVRDAVPQGRTIHVCDLGPVDNQLGYGAYSSVQGLEGVMPWNCHLRADPWTHVKALPDDYPTYEAAYVLSKEPQPPVSIGRDDEAAPDAIAQELPSVSDLETRLRRATRIPEDRCVDELNTGLFATHWGGLPASSIAESAVLDALDVFVNDCQENDDLWFQHPKFVGRKCQRNDRSLEHAAMRWQLNDNRAQNWMAGESLIRYLAAPLLFGTVSPRRIWHTAQYENLLFVCPLKRLVESREWHKLLAARNMDDSARYSYWRYHGFLCRYAETPMSEPATATEMSGMLLVHGFGASGAQWNKCMDELAAQGIDAMHQGLAPDLVGFGQSEKPSLSYSGYLWDSMVMDFVKEVAIAQNGWKSYITGGNSIGGYTSMALAACDAAVVGEGKATSSGAPGTCSCTGLVLMNSAGPVLSRKDVESESSPRLSVAQKTAGDLLPPSSPPLRPVARSFGNVLLTYLRPRIQSICVNLYPTNPSSVDDELCDGILRDSLDPGAIFVMMAGSKLPPPRTANEMLAADFGSSVESASVIAESSFRGPVLITQGILDPLNDAKDRLKRFGELRSDVVTDAIDAGHCPHDELPGRVASSIAKWIDSRRTSSQAVSTAELTSSS